MNDDVISHGPDAPGFPRQVWDALRLYFGLGLLGALGLLWSLLAVPLYYLLPRRAGVAFGRWLIHTAFRGYLRTLAAIGACRFDLSALDALRDQPPMIVAPNHPSLIDAVGVEQACLKTVAPGLEDFAAIDDIRSRQDGAALLVRAGIVGKAEDANAEADLPQRLCRHLGGSGCEASQQHSRGQDQCPEEFTHQHANSCDPGKATASISTSRSRRQTSACKYSARNPQPTRCCSSAWIAG